HFYRVNPTTLTSYQRMQYALLAAVVEMEVTPPERRAEIFAKVRRDLAAAAKEFEAYSPDFSMLKTYRRVVKRLAQLRGTWTAKLWSWYRQAVPLVKEKVFG